MSVAVEFAPEYLPQPEGVRPVPHRRGRPAGVGARRPAQVVALHRPSRSAPPLRLTRRGAVVLAGVVAVVAAGLVALAWASAPAATPAHRAPAAVTVHSGDTLWSIAARVAPERDPRAEVAALRRVNHLEGTQLRPGQVLRVG